MTDTEIIEKSRRIDKLLQAVRDIYNEIANSDHPNAAKICQDFDDNGIFVCAWARHVAHHGLEHPERWETGDWGIRLKRKMTNNVNPGSL